MNYLLLGLDDLGGFVLFCFVITERRSKVEWVPKCDIMIRTSPPSSDIADMEESWATVVMTSTIPNP